jgi:hypothetical protein
MSEFHVVTGDLPIRDAPSGSALCHDQDKHVEPSHTDVTEHQRFDDLESRTEDMFEEITLIPTSHGRVCRLTTANLELYGIVEEASAHEKCRNFLLSNQSVADSTDGMLLHPACEAPGASSDTVVNLTNDGNHYQTNCSNCVQTIAVQSAAPRSQVYEQRELVANDSQLHQKFYQFTFIGITRKRCPGCSTSFIGTHVGYSDYIQVWGV